MTITQTSHVEYDQAAWDMLTRFPFRPQMFFDSLATVKATRQSMPGSSVNFTFTNDLDEQTSELDETTDVTPVAISDSQVNITLHERGAAVGRTSLLQGTSFIPVDPVLANLIGFNAGLSFDTLARNPLFDAANTHVLYSGDATARAEIVPDDQLSASNVRKVVAQLRNANVPPLRGSYHVGYVNPDVSVDLREETGAAAWRDPHIYSKPEEVWNGEIGAFEGVAFMETPRCPILDGAGAGATSADVYQSLFVGGEALAKTFSSAVSGPVPTVRPSPITDKLWRFVHMGWYWLGGFGAFRQESIRRVESGSSLDEDYSAA